MKRYIVKRETEFTVEAEDENEARVIAAESDDCDYSGAEIEELPEIKE